ncbi:MAG: hypothetical protein ABSH22_01955 [Tepidisphaeraceae bacterium]|jgi:hypothetical protein
MNGLHAKTLRSFTNRLKWLFLLRAAVKGATVWLFLWGVVALAVKTSSLHQPQWLTSGLLGIIPAGAAAGWMARREFPAFSKIRASYDRLNACGGLIMSEEAADMSAWRSHLPAAAAPTVRWRGARPLAALAASALFAATSLLLPQRLTHFSLRHPLEIGQVADQLQAEVQTLRQEKIIPDQQAQDVEKQLSQIEQDSSGYDPDKTWEALDHIKESDSQAAKQAAEEALAKTTALTDAQALAQGMQQAADEGMNAATASQAAQVLANTLAAAKLEDGLLDAKLPPDLLNNLNGLDKEQLQKLLNSLQFNKDSLGQTAADLENLKLIDAATLDQLREAGKNIDPKALADYLAQCNGDLDPNSLAQFLIPGKGGRGGGGPPAPMTWSDGASEKDLKFQEHVLPPAAQLSDAKLVGVSRAAPQVSDATVATGHGALADAPGTGGSAHAQVVLPEQRQAVQTFFNRDKQ